MLSTLPATGNNNNKIAPIVPINDRRNCLKFAQQRKQEFMSMISHDLRTPLTSVQASLEFVGEAHDQDLPSDVRECLAVANTNIQTVLRLVDELLEIARIESGMLRLEYEEVHARELVLQALDAVKGIAQQKGITISILSSNAYFQADSDRLLRVLINLLGNAIKFSPNRTTITLRCTELEDAMEFSVEDQGRGIPAEYIEKVFVRFQQVSHEDARKLGGSGLGLAISKALVEGHGGTIDVESVEGQGSTFRFVVPKHRPKSHPQIGNSNPDGTDGMISNWLRHQAIAPKDRCNSIGGGSDSVAISQSDSGSWTISANPAAISLEAIERPSSPSSPTRSRGNRWGDPYYLRPFKA